MDKIKHKKQHQELHKALDELAADYIIYTKKSLRDTNILELMEWSYQQTQSPEEIK